jgi:hypothetical protein
MYNSLERLKDAIADVVMDESITTEQIVRAIKNEVTDWRDYYQNAAARTAEIDSKLGQDSIADSIWYNPDANINLGTGFGNYEYSSFNWPNNPGPVYSDGGQDSIVFS